MRLAVLPSLTLSLLIGFCWGLCLGQTTEITRKHHPWGRFQPGAWKLVRVVTESFEGPETLTSITHTRTVLKAVEEDSVTLLIEVSVQVPGKQFDAQPQTVKQSFHGELASEDLQITDLGTGQLAIQGRQIPCKIQQLELADAASKTVTKIYYSDSVEPYILKRESTKTDLEGKILSQTTVEVTDLDVPCNVLGVIRSSAQLKKVHKHPKGTTTTLAFTSMAVPGGIVCHRLTELDSSGRMIRRSTLDLVAYGLEPEQDDRGGFFRRRRSSRVRKPYRYYVPR